MSNTKDGTGGLTFDKSKRAWPSELNVLAALILIILVFEALGAWTLGQSFLLDSNDRFDSIFNEQRIKIIILQVAIIGIIALGVTQVIISGGIDLSSGSVVGVTAMVTMSFAQVAEVNGFPNPKAVFGAWAMDLPVIVPLIVGLLCGLAVGIINGTLIAYLRIPPFIVTLGMLLSVRGAAEWWSRGNPISFPTESYAALSNGDLVNAFSFGLFSAPGLNPVLYFLGLVLLFHLVMRYTVYGKHTYAIGSNEDAARMSGINVRRHKVRVYAIAGMLAAFAGILLSSKNLTAQAGMGDIYELYAIAMAVIGGVSLSGGRGSIFGTLLGALIIGVIQSGFIFLKIDAYYQKMVFGAIIIGAVALDQWRQKQSLGRR